METGSEKKPRWFIVHTYSGHENKVAKTLMQRVEAMGFKERILDVLVPTKEIVKVRSGKKETVKEKETKPKKVAKSKEKKSV